MAKYSYAMLFRDFKQDYPHKLKRGTSYIPDGFMAIQVYIPGDGIYKYEFFGKKLTLIKKFLTPRQDKVLKIHDREMKMLRISDKMKTFGVSQSCLSRVSGISRESINKYISGSRVPKLSTLELLDEALHQITSRDEEFG